MCQIDLMVADQPLISYKSDKKNERSMFGSREEVNEMDNLSEAWKKKRKNRSYAGKTFSLNDFMANKLL